MNPRTFDRENVVQAWREFESSVPRFPYASKQIDFLHQLSAALTFISGSERIIIPLRPSYIVFVLLDPRFAAWRVDNGAEDRFRPYHYGGGIFFRATIQELSVVPASSPLVLGIIMCNLGSNLFWRPCGRLGKCQQWKTFFSGTHKLADPFCGGRERNHSQRRPGCTVG